jgi:PPK2 family polyphosphate:nucleotide phosphotransferase
MTTSLSEALDTLRVAPGKDPELDSRSKNATFGLDKAATAETLATMKAEIDLLQQRLYAEERHSVLLVVQAMDAAGKDGTIRTVLTGLNPAGCHVTNFRVPGGPEVEHDYLWRVHQATPKRGRIGVWNRSHYEDVLVVRVKELVPEQQWRRRYEHIRGFEQMLVDEGTRVVKVFLDVSKEKQAERLKERLDDPEKQWKFRAGDLQDRALWPEYQRAYTDALAKTSTKAAPWYVVPADRNWVRNLLVTRLLLDVLQEIDPELPLPEEGLESITIDEM